MATIQGTVKELQKIKGTVRDKNRISGSVAAILLQGSGGGMDGEFTTCIASNPGGDYEIDKIESDKVKIVIADGVSYDCRRLGSRGSTIKAGTQKLIWINLVSDSSTIHFYGAALGADGIFLAGNEGSMDLVYSGFHNHNLIFLAVNLAENQWILTPYGLGNVDEMIQNSLGDYVEKETDKSLVADTEIAKIHEKDHDFYLDKDGEFQVDADGLFQAIGMLGDLQAVSHVQNSDTKLADGTVNEVSAAELRSVVDFANISTPPTAYQIPVVQDLLGVKSLKYSDDFVFENGTLKVKGLVEIDEKNITVSRNGILTFGNLNSGVASAVRIYTKNLEAIRITPQQNVGIKTTTPNKSLEVSHDTGDCFRLSYDKSTTYKADFTLDSDGNLTIAPAGRTNIGYLHLSDNLNTRIGNFTYTSADPEKDTEGDWRQYSDGNAFYTQYCTVGNATKGGGTWITKFTIEI